MYPVRILTTTLHIGPARDFDRATAVVVVHLSPDADILNADGWRRALESLGLDTRADLEIRTLTEVPVALTALACTSLWLQRKAGHEVMHAMINPSRDGLWTVRLEYEDAQTALWSAELASDLLAAKTTIGEWDPMVRERLGAEIGEFLEFAAWRRLDPSTRLLARAATARGIPWIDLDQFPFEEAPLGRIPRRGLLQVGQGCHGRRLLGSLPGDLDEPTLGRMQSHAAIRAALRRAGLPVPSGDPENSYLNRSSRAVRAAERIGFPVVLRPATRSPLEAPELWKPVYGPLLTPEHVGAAYESLAQLGREVLIEASVAGERQRWLVIGGEVRAVARCSPPKLIGDGEAGIQQLIEREAHRHRDDIRAAAWRRMAQPSGDVDLRLHLQDLTRQSVPGPGVPVVLAADCTPHHGGSFTDCSDGAEPELYPLVLAAARACGLECFCGVDLVIQDGGARNAVILDVVAGPDLYGHQFPDAGKPRDVAGMLLDHWFPDPEQARVPVFAVTGTNGKTTTAAMVAKIMSHAGYQTALVTTAGVAIGGDWLARQDLAGVAGARFALADPRTELLVVEAARGGLVKFGLPFDRCDVSACLNVEHDHIGSDGIETIEDLARVKRWILECCTRAGVVNADDERCLAMRPQISAKQALLVTRNPRKAAVQEHLTAGGAAIVLESFAGSDHIALRIGTNLTPLVGVKDIPATWGGRVRAAVDNAMHASAMAIGYGVSPEIVGQGLRHFDYDPKILPCRMQMVVREPFAVLLDHAHNAHSLCALTDAIKAVPVTGRRILAFVIPDDRRDDAILAAAEAVANEYDHYFCKGMSQSRAADPERAPRLLASGLRAAGVPDDHITVIRDPLAATRAALALIRPGDFLVITSSERTCKRHRVLIEEAVSNLNPMDR